MCVIEQADTLGGYLANFKRKGFCFDCSIHWVNQCGENGIVRNLFNFIGPNAPITPLQKNIRRMKGDSFDYLLTNNPDQLKEEFIHDFPKAKKGIINFFTDAKKIGQFFIESSTKYRTAQSMPFYEYWILKKNIVHYTFFFIKFLSTSITKGLNKYFKNENLKKIFCSESNLMSCLVPIGWAYVGEYQHVPPKGAYEFIQWLENLLNKSESEIFCQSKVLKIILENKTATGVIVKKGNDVFEIKSDIVVSAGDIETLYTKMLPKGIISNKFLNKLKTADIYKSAVTLYLGLDCPIDDIGIGEEIILLTRDDVSRDEQVSTDPSKAAITVFSPSAANPLMAPKGKSTLIVFIQASFDYADYWKIERDGDGNFIRGEKYKKFKKEFADILIDRVEDKLIPDLRKHIEVLEVATPITYHRYTSNREGSMMGARPGMKNMRANIAHYKTPVKNLYLAGHWSEYGGGIPCTITAAVNSSLLVLRKRKPEFYKKLKNVADGK